VYGDSVRFLKLRWRWCQATVALVAAVPILVFGSPQASGVGLPAETLVRPWHLDPGHSEDKRGVRIAVTSGYCYGEGRPHIDHVKVVETGVPGGRDKGRAIITVFEHEPPFRDAEALCRDLGLTLRKFVRLRRPVARLSLYDGSSRPPRLVAPRGGG
jgi:hypothetical protein